uniref:DAG_kinase_N domain-containing protein n=1 Tax=Anopheles christyi TaxID=43041 RepID=A0A182K774_9DIPT
MASNIHKWEKLSPSEFQQLQDLASYSTKKLQNVLQEFCSPATPSASRFHPDGVLGCVQSLSIMPGDADSRSVERHGSRDDTPRTKVSKFLFPFTPAFTPSFES